MVGGMATDAKGPGDGRTALITGPTTGIGRALAALFAADRWRLILVSRRPAVLRALAAELRRAHGTVALVVPADLGRPGAPDRVAKAVRARGWRVDALVNNAGFGSFGPFAESLPGPQVEMIQVNVTALVHLTRLFLPGMIARRSGRILNVASLAAFQPGPLMAVYYATKAFVLSFSEALTEELRGAGITVTALCPGPTRSEFGKRADTLGSRLMSGNVLKVAETLPVAEAGYRAMLRGTAVCVPGLMNKLMAQGPRLGPRGLVRRIVKVMQGKRLVRK